MCFPHELLGYDRDDYAGILLSLEIARDVNRQQQEYEKSNKSKAKQRSSRAPRRSGSNPKRPTKG